VILWQFPPLILFCLFVNIWICCPYTQEFDDNHVHMHLLPSYSWHSCACYMKKLKCLHQTTWRDLNLNPKEILHIVVWAFTWTQTHISKQTKIKSNQTNKNLSPHLTSDNNVTTINNLLEMLKLEQLQSRVQMHQNEVEMLPFGNH
jgi:hypothetical protein